MCLLRRKKSELLRLFYFKDKILFGISSSIHIGKNHHKNAALVGDAGYVNFATMHLNYFFAHR